MSYDSWCRRMDLKFRARYPYLNTKIFRIDNFNYQIFVVESVANFSALAQAFDNKIRYVGTAVKLTNTEPTVYKYQLHGIQDTDIPSHFEGLPFSIYDLYNHISSLHPNVTIVQIYEDHSQQTIHVNIEGQLSPLLLNELKTTLNHLGSPYAFVVKDCCDETTLSSEEAGSDVVPRNEVFNILSSRSQSHLNCPFLERDEKLWFDNINHIYDGSLSKSDLYFIEPDKVSCFIDFSLFPNINLRNHILLYDIVYCTLPPNGTYGQFPYCSEVRERRYIIFSGTGAIEDSQCTAGIKIRLRIPQ